MSDTTSVNEHPESFRFTNEGDRFDGTVTDYSEGIGKFGPVPILQASDANGKVWSVWLFSSILKEKVGRAAPKPGERVVVTYLGERTSQASGNTYKAWSVDCPDREATLPDFAGWAAYSTYQGELPPDDGGSPWTA